MTQPRWAMLGPRDAVKATTLMRSIPPRLFRNSSASAFVWTLFCAASLGCAGKPPVPPACDKSETLTVYLSPSQQLNPDREGYARSVITRVYQLEGDRAVQDLDFDELWARSIDGPPAAPIVAVGEELTLVPGRPEVRAVKRHAQATHVLIAAKFRDHTPTSAWRASAPLPPPIDPCTTPSPPGARLQVELANYSLRIR